MNNFTAAPSGTFKTIDGYINISANKQEQWESVTELLGVPELKEDLRFKKEMQERKTVLHLSYLEEKLVQNTTEYWVIYLMKHDVHRSYTFSWSGSYFTTGRI